MDWYENETLWYCSVVLLFGLLALAVVYRLGKFLSERNVVNINEGWPEVLGRLLDYYLKINYRANLPRHLLEANSEYLQRRNEFWSTYLQVVVAVVIVVVLAILLLTNTISAEAGLPILSAISGFAIAKGVSTNKVDRQDDRDEPRKPPPTG